MKTREHAPAKVAATPPGFRFQREVASGPLASVVEARDEASGQAVFVKRLLPRGRDDAGARAAFCREARIGQALALAGARVAPVLLADEDELGPYLVTGAVGGPLPPAASWAAAARTGLAALASVHDAADAQGRLEVVHHDVHLDNLRWAGDGAQAWLVDFGLASARADVNGAAAPDDAVFRGTLRYAAPEAARGEASTPGSDRFSLAAALLHRASGVDPRGGASAPAELLYRAGTEPLDAWRSSIERSAPPELAALARALAPLLAFAAGDRRAEPAW